MQITIEDTMPPIKISLTSGFTIMMCDLLGNR